MNLADVGEAVWRRRWRSLLLAVIAATIAVAFTYDISSSGLRPRALRLGVAQTNLLLDAGQSPLASTATSVGVASIAADIAQSTQANFVIQAAARALHVPPAQIGIQQQVIQDLPRSAVYAQEAQIGNQIITSRQKYNVLVRNDQGTFVIQLYTQAPTGAQAVTLATAVSHALILHIDQLVRSEHISHPSRVILRQLAPARGGLVGADVTRNAAILIGLIAWVLLMIASFSVDRGRRERHRKLEDRAPPAISDPA